MIGKEKRIVIATEFISPSSNSTGEYLSHIIWDLLSNQQNVVLVLPSTEDNLEYYRHLSSAFSSSLSAHFVSRAPDFKGTSFKKAFSSFMLTAKIWLQVRKLLSARDVLFFCTNPTFLLPFLSLFTRVKGARKVMLCYDIFPDNLSAISSSRIHRCVTRLIKPLFNYSVKNLDKVIVIGRCMYSRIYERARSPSNVVIVSNWADGKEILPISRNGPPESNVVFQFFGNIGPLQGIDIILNAVKYITASNVTIKFWGRGALTQALIKFIETNNTQVSVAYHGEVARSDRNFVLNECDIALVSLDHSVTGLGVPSKTYFSLAAGKPLLVISAAEAEPAQIVKDLNLGWVCESISPADLAALIDKICASREIWPQPDYIRHQFEQRFSRDIGVRAVVDEIVSQV